MGAFAQGDVPRGHFKIARVHDPVQHLGHTRPMNAALPILREIGLGLKKSLHICLCREPTRGETFKRFPHDGSNRLIGDKPFSLVLEFGVDVSDWRGENKMPAKESRPHAVDDLLAVFDALVFGIERLHVFEEEAVATVAEHD
nr:hypothetical protein [Caulobacter soli]